MEKSAYVFFDSFYGYGPNNNIFNSWTAFLGQFTYEILCLLLYFVAVWIYCDFPGQSLLTSWPNNFWSHNYYHFFIDLEYHINLFVYVSYPYIVVRNNDFRYSQWIIFLRIIKFIPNILLRISTSLWAQGTIWGVTDRSQVGLLQGELPTHFTIQSEKYLMLIITINIYTSLVTYHN